MANQKMYFELMGSRVDLELTPDTCVSELVEALYDNGLLDPELMSAQSMMFVNTKTKDKIVYSPAEEAQKTISQMGLVGDVIYTIVPDNFVA